MAMRQKQDSNSTGLRYCQEQSIGVLPGSPVWIPLEPNDYNDFGGTLSLIARDPINPSRQRKKGVITDLDASGGFPMDLTQTNLQDLLQGFMFATMRRKNPVVAISAVDGSGVYSISNTSGFVVGSIVNCSGFLSSVNNGIKIVSAISAGVSITLSGTSAIETPSATATLSIVGYRSQVSADIKVSALGGYPTLTSTALDFTTLQLIPGEWVFLGGDVSANQYATSANNGFKRIKSIAANTIVLDKSDQTMVTDTATGKFIDIYFGKVLKNEIGTNIIRRTYQLERTLGAPDDSLPTQEGSEYLVGAVPSEFTLNIPTAEKITTDLSFVAIDHEPRSHLVGLKPGTRPALVESSAFNTSSDFSRIKLYALSATDAAPPALVGYLTSLNLTINNNLTPNKAVGILGAFDVSAGSFIVSGESTAYFTEVSAIQAVRNNADVTLDIAVVKNNAGFVVDLPLVALGNGLANVKKDEPITISLTTEAATGASWDANMDHTLLFVFYDYLPNLADV